MRKIIEKIVHFRNPQFRFDEHITSSMILELMFDKSMMFMRAFMFHVFRLKKPQLLFFGRQVHFYNYRNISLGKWVRLDDWVFLGALGKGKLAIGNNSGIGAFSRIEISQSFNNIGNSITIGDNVGIGPYASLGGAGGLEIGDECIIGPYLSCHPENHHFEKLEVSIRHQGVYRQGIKIGKNCWIGAKVSILDGVEIGEGSVIAAGAVVTKSFPPNSVVGGIPAKLIKSRKVESIKVA
jgi:acetyltransferase-like isoleucine patch superfamily enzyme